jgi:hypothetical protein
MLDRGRYIPERKPVIGRSYVNYRAKSNLSPEENFMQEVLLAEEVNKSALMKFVSKILWV